ncbi:hypothetical protein HZ994_04725 [Akkermansiaceae bacterium]|nr:hypothetical protein HZ994_04725 [Akkermansiaceae bacterium]
MADIKGALRNIPEKQTGEEPADEGQKGYLRSFGYFSEKLIKDLGALQASYLIDQAELIKAEGSANIDLSGKKSGKLGGLVRLIVLCAVLILAIVIGKKFLGSGTDDQATRSESQTDKSLPEVSGNAGGQEGSQMEGAQKTEDPITEPQPDSGWKSLDLATIEYPATVLCTKGFSLLNHEGKETPIPVGTMIEIADRTDLGTLKMQIDGELFVGNESRVAGNVELK